MKIKKTVTREVYETVEYTCDICGKTIKMGDEYSYIYRHYDWGCDSGDSVENVDVCSPECYIKSLCVALKELDCNDKTGEIDEKPYRFVEKLYKLYGGVVK